MPSHLGIADASCITRARMTGVWFGAVEGRVQYRVQAS